MVRVDVDGHKFNAIAGDDARIEGDTTNVVLDPATGEMSTGDIAEQTDRVLRSLSAVLASAGASLSTVIKTTVFMRDLGEFAAMNEVYAAAYPAFW